MLKHTRDYEDLEHYTSLINDFKEEYLDIYNKEILNFLKDDLSDDQIELFICKLSSTLDNIQMIALLLDEMYNIINKIKSMKDGESRYYVIENLLQFLLEKGLKLSESQKTKSIEFLIRILFLNMDIDIVLYVENIFQFVHKLFNILEYYDIVELLNNEELKIIENLSSHYKRRSHHMFVLELFYLIYLKLRLDSERIIKIHNSIPENLRKEIISEFKRLSREHYDLEIEYALLVEDGEPDDWFLYHPNDDKSEIEKREYAEKIVKILDSFTPYQSPKKKNNTIKSKKIDINFVLNQVAQVLNISKSICDTAATYYINIIRKEEKIDNNFSLLANCINNALHKENLPFTLTDIWGAFNNLNYEVDLLEILKVSIKYEKYFS